MIVKNKLVIYFLGLLFVSLVAATSFWIYSHFQNTSSSTAGDKMYKAVLFGDKSSADISETEKIKILEEVSTSNSSYQSLAKLQLAVILSNSDFARSLKLYSELENDKKLEPSIKELAGYMKLLLKIKHNEIKLTDLPAQTKVYTDSYQELAAVITMTNDEVQAEQLLKKMLENPEMQPNVRKNAEELFQIIGGSHQ